MKSSEIITIPDGYLIDMMVPTDPKLYVIENEIVNHDPFKHIGIQMLKFVTSFEDSQTSIRNFIMDYISKDKEKLKRLEDGCSNSNSRNIDNYLDQAVYGEFGGIVVIDEARPELHKVLEKINANISVLELKSYLSSNGKVVYQYDTLYEDVEGPMVNMNTKSKIEGADRNKRLQRRAASDTIIVPAKEEGFKAEFINNSQWFAIRIGAAMKDRIKYIAAYQVAPISAVTHIAEIQEIKPYKDTGKYIVKFKGSAEKLSAPIKVTDPNKAPQGPVYVKKDSLLMADSLEEAMEI